MNKFEFVRGLLEHEARRTGLTRPSILDVGCRDCSLHDYVREFAEYDGMDLYQNPRGAVRYVADLSRGIPVSDASYDCAVALDVVEHVDDMVASLDELVRIVRHSAFVMLPNLAHILPRARFLFTGRFSAKYDIRFPQSEDRHRWFTTQPQCDAFMKDYCKSRNLTLQTQWYLDGPRKATIATIMRLLGLSPALWVWAGVYVLQKQHSTGVVAS
jgi:SAM-dependent methyltransferase